MVTTGSNKSRAQITTGFLAHYIHWTTENRQRQGAIFTWRINVQSAHRRNVSLAHWFQIHPRIRLIDALFRD
jgi:hypothetical protein